MKKIIIALFILIGFSVGVNAQSKSKPQSKKPAAKTTTKPVVNKNEEGDAVQKLTTRDYVMVFVKAVPSSSELSAQNNQGEQEKFMERISKMKEEGSLVMYGNIKDDKQLKMILIMRSSDIGEVAKELNKVESGFKFEFRLWNAEIGAQLPE